MLGFAQVYFLNLQECKLLYFANYCVFGGCKCKKLFSWLGQKVNKTIDAYGQLLATTPVTLAQICAQGPRMMLRPSMTSRDRSVF